MTQEEDNFDSQVLGSPYSLSLPSEPPDIRNWFSSYVYESPASDTIKDFECSSFKESQCKKERLDAEDSNREKEENSGELRRIDITVGEKTAPNEFVKCKRDNNLGNTHVNEPHLWNDLCSKKIRKPGHGGAISPIKDCKKSSSNHEDSFPLLGRNFSLDFSKANKNIGENERKSPIKLAPRTSSNRGNSEAKAQTKGVGVVSAEAAPYLVEVNGDFTKKSGLQSNDKENGGKRSAESGFVSTRKNRCGEENDQNYLKKPLAFQSSTGEKNVGESRKALSEKTNLQQSCVTEITGKWRCPQRRKPDLGPPLKQLRLERWVHRL